MLLFRIKKKKKAENKTKKETELPTCGKEATPVTPRGPSGLPAPHPSPGQVSDLSQVPAIPRRPRCEGQVPSPCS